MTEFMSRDLGVIQRKRQAEEEEGTDTLKSLPENEFDGLTDEQKAQNVEQFGEGGGLPVDPVDPPSEPTPIETVPEPGSTRDIPFDAPDVAEKIQEKREAETPEVIEPPDVHGMEDVKGDIDEVYERRNELKPSVPADTFFLLKKDEDEMLELFRYGRVDEEQVRVWGLHKRLKEGGSILMESEDNVRAYFKHGLLDPHVVAAYGDIRRKIQGEGDPITKDALFALQQISHGEEPQSVYENFKGVEQALISPPEILAALGAGGLMYAPKMLGHSFIGSTFGKSVAMEGLMDVGAQVGYGVASKYTNEIDNPVVREGANLLGSLFGAGVPSLTQYTGKGLRNVFRGLWDTKPEQVQALQDTLEKDPFSVLSQQFLGPLKEGKYQVFRGDAVDNTTTALKRFVGVGSDENFLQFQKMSNSESFDGTAVKTSLVREYNKIKRMAKTALKKDFNSIDRQQVVDKVNGFFLEHGDRIRRATYEVSETKRLMDAIGQTKVANEPSAEFFDKYGYLKYHTREGGVKYDVPAGSMRDLKTGTIKTSGRKVGRNEPCVCGSGKKFERCCLAEGVGTDLLRTLAPARQAIRQFNELSGTMNTGLLGDLALEYNRLRKKINTAESRLLRDGNTRSIPEFYDAFDEMKRWTNANNRKVHDKLYTYSPVNRAEVTAVNVREQFLSQPKVKKPATVSRTQKTVEAKQGVSMGQEALVQGVKKTGVPKSYGMDEATFRKALDGMLWNEGPVTETVRPMSELLAKNGATVPEALRTLENSVPEIVNGKRALGTSIDTLRERGRDYTKAWAKAMGKSEADLESAVKLSADTLKNAEQVQDTMLVLNEFMVQSLRALQQRARNVESMSLLEKLEFTEQLDFVLQLVENMYGIRGAAGRTLRQYREITGQMAALGNYRGVSAEQLDAIAGSSGKNLDKWIKKFGEAKSPEELIGNSVRFGRSGIWNAILTAEQAMLISHYSTWLKNIVGTSYSAIHTGIAKSVGIRYDAWRKAGGFLHPTSFDDVTMIELQMRRQGYLVALKQSLKNPQNLLKVQKLWAGDKETWDSLGDVWKSLLTGKSQVDPYHARLEGMEDNLDLGFLRKRFTVAGRDLTMGDVFKVFFHPLAAGDETFKQLSIYSNLYGEAYVDAVKRGMPQDQIQDWVEKEVKNIQMDDARWLRAQQTARVDTFAQELSGTAKGVEDLLNDRGGGWVGTMTKAAAMPFYKTIVNLASWSRDNSAFALMTKKAWQTLRHGTEREQGELVARMTMGTGMAFMGYTMYQAGVLTPYFNEDESIMGWGVGMLENAVHGETEDGKRWFIQVQGMEPMSMMIAAGSAAGKAWNRWVQYSEYMDLPQETRDMDAELTFVNSVVSPIAMIFAQGMLPMELMENTIETVDNAKKVMEGERDGIRLATDQLNKFYPRFLDMVRDTTQMREVRTPWDVVDKIFNPEKLNETRHMVYGTSMERAGRFGGVLNRSIREIDPFLDAMLEHGVQPRSLPKRVTRSKVGLNGVELSNDDHNLMKSLIDADSLASRGKQLVESTWFKEELTVEEKQDEISDLISEEHGRARDRFLHETESGRELLRKGYNYMHMEKPTEPKQNARAYLGMK